MNIWSVFPGESINSLFDMKRTRRHFIVSLLAGLSYRVMAIIFALGFLHNVAAEELWTCTLKGECVEVINVRDIENSRDISIGLAHILRCEGPVSAIEPKNRLMFSRFRKIKIRVASPPFSGLVGTFLLAIDEQFFVVSVWSWENHVSISRAHCVTEGVWQESTEKSDVGNWNDKALADLSRRVIGKPRRTDDQGEVKPNPSMQSKASSDK